MLHRILLTTFLLFLVCPLSNLRAQTTRQVQPEQRRVLVDNLLRNLIDSRNNLGSTAPLVNVPSSRVTGDVQQARQLIKSFRDEIRRLAAALQVEANYSHEARILLGDALPIVASADVLDQRAARMSTVQQIAAEHPDLDSRWRVFSHRTRQTPYLGTSVTRHVDTLDRYNSQLEEILKLDPQVDRTTIATLLSSLAVELDHLLDDIRIELVSASQRPQLNTELRRLSTAIQQMRSGVISSASYTTLQSQYKSFYSQWLPVKAKLRQYDNLHMQRNVNRINELTQHLHESLLLPRVIDGNDVLYMANQLKINVDRVCDQVTLRRLIALPNATDFFTKASEFYVLVDDFRQSVVTKTKLEDLLWDFQVLEVSWQDLFEVLRQFDDPDAAQSVAIIETSVNELRLALGITTAVDRQEAVELAAELSNMTDLLHYDIMRFVGRSNRYSAQYRNQTVSTSKQLREAVHGLSESVSGNASDVQVREQAQRIYGEWNMLQGAIAQIAAADRDEIIRTCQSISPMLAKLQVLYAY
ncbi:MAG: hypothetical protein KDA60_11030 [Planctomycetales bacterium]|nr:hypothetical protein [Planctomycetales bacterium]